MKDESEQIYKILFEGAAEGILVADVNSKKFIFANPSMCNLLKYTEEELKQLTVMDIHPNKDLDHVLSEFKAQAQGEKILAANIPCLKKDGEIIFVDIKTTKVLINEREYNIGFFSDVTERLNAEKHFHTYIHFLESLDRIEGAIKSSINIEQMLKDVLLEVFAIFKCDRAWLLYPCDPDAPTYRVPFEVSRPGYPGAFIQDLDVPMKPGADEVSRIILATENPVAFGPNGDSPLYKEVTEQFGVLSQLVIAIHPKLDKPWMLGMHQCSFMRHWTEDEYALLKEIGRRIADGLNSLFILQQLQKSEEKYRQLVENTNDVIFILDVNGILIHITNNVSKYGFLPHDLISHSISEILFKKDLSHVFEDFKNLILTKKPSQSSFRIQGSSGNNIWVEANSTVILDSSGEITGVTGVCRDITKRKQMEIEYEKLQLQHIQSQKLESLGRLAGGIAHDFNNILAVILGNTELIMSEIDSTHVFYSEILEIRKAAQRSTNLTKQLLSFARKQTISPKIINLNNIISYMIKLLRRLIGEAIKLLWKPGTHLWPIKMDPSQVDQILVNLTINARDAIDGVGTLIVETKNVVIDETYSVTHSDIIPGDYVLLMVNDDGCGMEKEVLNNLFEPFFTTKELGKGTGLGLATIYGNVKQNNGFIDVNSEPNQGSSFKIYLPRSTISEEEPEQVSIQAKPYRGTETVLLVEDEKAILKLVKKTLEDYGYTVLSTISPNTALNLANKYEKPIDLLISDVVMPGMNGLKLAKQISLIYPNIKHLFMSGYSDNIITHKGILSEGVYFIQKPFSMTLLIYKVQEILNQK